MTNSGTCAVVRWVARIVNPEAEAKERLQSHPRQNIDSFYNLSQGLVNFIFIRWKIGNSII